MNINYIIVSLIFILQVKMYKGSRLDIRLPSITATAFSPRVGSTSSSTPARSPSYLGRSPKLDGKDVLEEESDMDEGRLTLYVLLLLFSAVWLYAH